MDIRREVGGGSDNMRWVTDLMVTCFFPDSPSSRR
jgi:hypothetical protein